MDTSIFRNDIFSQETAFFLMNTFLVPKYLRSNQYVYTPKENKRYLDELKEKATLNLPKGHLNISEHYLVETFMKRCFNKCRQFVLEDWIDYDELDCTMRCAVLHRKSYEIMRETYDDNK
jgi:hypothetical protein